MTSNSNSNSNSIHKHNSHAHGQKSLRSACDLCHQGKVKCSGGTPCNGCRDLDVECTYSTSNRTGRPKGVKNKKTLERIKQMRAATGNEQEERASSSQTTSTQGSRQPSPSRPSSGENTDYASSSTSPSLVGDHICQSNMANSMANNSAPMQFWNFYPTPDLGHFQSDPDHNSALQRTYTNDTISSPGSAIFNSIDVPNDNPSDYSWIDSLLNTSDVVPPRPEGHLSKTAPGLDQNSSYAAVPPLPSMAQSLPQVNNLSACNCVQQLTSQLTGLKALSRSHHLLRPDVVLTAARDALSGWQAHMQCPSCQHSGDKDNLVLSVMALRALLDLIQKTRSSGDASTKDILSSPTLDGDHSFLGTYQLMCEEKRLVVDMLLQRTLKNLNCTIEHLKQKSLSIVGSTPSHGTMSNSSSRSNSDIFTLPTGSAAYRGVPDDMTLTGGMAGLESKDGMSLDEHDSYLQGSLQNSTATIESLLGSSQAFAKIPG